MKFFPDTACACGCLFCDIWNVGVLIEHDSWLLRVMIHTQFSYNSIDTHKYHP